MRGLSCSRGDPFGEIPRASVQTWCLLVTQARSSGFSGGLRLGSGTLGCELHLRKCMYGGDEASVTTLCELRKSLGQDGDMFD